MKLRSNFDSAGIFQGFSVLDCYGGGEWSSASDFKSIVLAYRRALIDANASPMTRRGVVESGYTGEERRA